MKLTKSNFNEAIANDRTLVSFGATWCGYCRVLEPAIQEFTEKYSHMITFAKVDVDQEVELTNQHHIVTYPTFILFEGGVEVDRKTTANSIEELEKMIKG